MATRRFGPVLGAGVQIEEKEGDVQILPAPTGVTILAGEFEKGPRDEPQFLSGKLDLAKRNGSRISEGFAPVAANDFYTLGRGAGELITYRVTGGDEKASEIELYNRQGTAAPPASGRALLGKLKAKNGGRWGGQRRTYVDDHTGVGDLTATTLDTGDTFVENEWAGGTLDLKKITTKTYRIVGNTAAGVISVEADQDLVADFNAGSGTPANRYVLTRQNVDALGNVQHLAVRVGNGQENPTADFSLKIFEDGLLVKSYDNLSTDPTKVSYWVKIINDDPSNHWVVAEDLFTGDKTVASARPANFQGQSKTLTALTLTLPDPDVTVDSPGGADPTVAIGGLGAKVVSQVLTGTIENTGADIRWTSSIGPVQVVQTGFSGIPTDLGPEALTVTVTNGGTALADGDKIIINLLVLVPGELVGGEVLPDVVNKPALAFIIDANTANSVSVRTGLDLTDGGGIAAGAIFQLQYPQQFGIGNNSKTVTDADFLLAFDPNLSPLNKLFGKNKGLVKIAAPGITSTVVTKKGIEYAAARNYQYKVEIPSNVLDESAAINHINSTIGRSDYASTHFPSFGSVLDPDATPGANDVPLKEQPLIGMILGREAIVARNFDGYHKAPAGIDVTLPDVLRLTTGGSEDATVLNEELLNPQGINVVKFRQGSVILWGDRTISPTSEWKFYHQRSLMSHYENILRENFEFIIFAINNRQTQERAATTMRAFFLPEFIKGALRGKKFEGDAFKLKIDDENNTDLTRSQGDLNAELTLRLADTVERFKIVIGKAGIFDAAA